MKRILFVGSNPSESSPDDSEFHLATRSRKTIDRWIRDLDVSPLFLNVCSGKMVGNKAPSITQVRQELPRLLKQINELQPEKIIAVGAVARWALDQLRCSHYPVPHPSGLCRIWNCKEQAAQLINDLRDYIQK
jgi:uracil-DNA glycosylase